MSERTVVDHESQVPKLKRLGVIGGMGQWATYDILSRIDRESGKRIPQYGNRGYPEKDIRMINKTPMIIAPNDPEHYYPEKLEPSKELLEAARFVGKNTDFIIVTSNTAHIFRRQIEEAAGKPLVSLVDVAVDEVKKRQCKRVGLMAIGVTLRERLFQKPLEEIGVDSVLLPQELGERLENEGIYPLQEAANPKEVSGIAYEAVDYLRKQGTDGIILGCTEIPILLDQAANDPDIINPSQLLAEEVIRRVK